MLTLEQVIAMALKNESVGRNDRSSDERRQNGAACDAGALR
jgi:hypothetical protein